MNTAQVHVQCSTESLYYVDFQVFAAPGQVPPQHLFNPFFENIVSTDCLRASSACCCHTLNHTVPTGGADSDEVNPYSYVFKADLIRKKGLAVYCSTLAAESRPYQTHCA